MAGLILLPSNSSAQQKPADKENGKKTITIKVTTETDGKVVKIDTTFVAEGDFDEDAFLKEKGIVTEEKAEGNVQKNVIIRHPSAEDYKYLESFGNSHDTIVVNGGRVIILNDKFDMPVPPPFPGMSENFKMPQCCPPMYGPQFEHMLQGMLKSMDLEDMMPFGDLDNIVVKKKNNGKKVIITFEDRDEANPKHQSADKKQEKVIIYKNGEQGMTPQNEEHYVIQGENGEKIIINKNVVTNGNEKTVTVKADVDNSVPVKQEKKIIIIKEADIK
jgi:hypothetical protein